MVELKNLNDVWQKARTTKQLCREASTGWQRNLLLVIHSSHHHILPMDIYPCTSWHVLHGFCSRVTLFAGGCVFSGRAFSGTDASLSHLGHLR